MNEWIDPRSRAWAVVALIGGIGLFLGLELIDDPDASGLDLVLELLEIVPIVLTSVGLVLLFQFTRRQSENQVKLIRELEIARAQGQRWRAEARAHLNGLGQAIDAQFSRWNLTEAEREVALLLLKGSATRRSPRSGRPANAPSASRPARSMPRPDLLAGPPCRRSSSRI